MIAPVKRHKHTYKLIGTSHVMSFPASGFIMCDLICDKCGKTTTAYTYDKYSEQIMDWAAKGKYFNVVNCKIESSR